MALGSTQPRKEMSTRNLPGGKKRPARRADNLAAVYTGITLLLSCTFKLKEPGTGLCDKNVG
jgi:hypothetical protein